MDSTKRNACIKAFFSESFTNMPEDNTIVDQTEALTPISSKNLSSEITADVEEQIVLPTTTTSNNNHHQVPPSKTITESDNREGEANKRVPVDPEALNLDPEIIPTHLLQTIFQKANSLLNDPGSITAAASDDISMRTVRSAAGQKPHIVKQKGKSRYFLHCDCRFFNWYQFCAHSLAVSVDLNICFEYLVEMKKKLPTSNNSLEAAIDGNRPLTAKGMKKNEIRQKAYQAKKKGNNGTDTIISTRNRPKNSGIISNSHTKERMGTTKTRPNVSQKNTNHQLQLTPPENQSIQQRPPPTAATNTQNHQLQLAPPENQSIQQRPPSTAATNTQNHQLQLAPPENQSIQQRHPPSAATTQNHQLQLAPPENQSIQQRHPPTAATNAQSHQLQLVQTGNQFTQQRQYVFQQQTSAFTSETNQFSNNFPPFQRQELSFAQRKGAFVNADQHYTQENFLSPNNNARSPVSFSLSSNTAIRNFFPSNANNQWYSGMSPYQYYVVQTPNAVKSCYGCNEEFDDSYYSPPNNIVIKHYDRRITGKAPEGGLAYNKEFTAAYYHPPKKHIKMKNKANYDGTVIIPKQMQARVDQQFLINLLTSNGLIPIWE